MNSFDFLSSLVNTRSILDVAVPITQSVQSLAIDIADARNLIESLKIFICCKRSSSHKKCYSDILQLACKVGIEEWKSRISEFQWKCNNVALESTSDYFEKVVRIRFDILTFNHLTVEIETRFNHASVSVYSGLVIILSNLVSLVYENVNWKKYFICWSFQRRFSISESVADRTGVMGNILTENYRLPSRQHIKLI